MSPTTNGRDELDAALAALDIVASLVAAGKEAFDTSQDRQLSLVYLWANIGSQLKQYCRKLEIPPGTEPFAGPVQMRDRLVYGSVLALDARLVWDTCVISGPELRRLIGDLRSAL